MLPPRIARRRVATALVVVLVAGLVVALGTAAALVTHLAELAYLRLAIRVTG